MHRARSRSFSIVSAALVFAVIGISQRPLLAELKTWDGKHSIDKIDVTVVYFVPKDREPLPDWKDRISYFCRRIERFHEREFQGQSTMTTLMRPEPFRSARTTEQLRGGDGDFIFFQTLREVDETLSFARGERTAFPILLVLSEINWKPLDDFFRVKPTSDGGWKFEGNYSNGRHFPGAESGGARATYIAGRGVGWGLVSADGWRVPYCGTDCVVYHEGCGHTVGLPHPEPGNKSVMSLGQYHGWISESWLDEAQKKRLGWQPPEQPFDRKADLFSMFTALPEPRVPKSDERVSLRLTWPEPARVKSCRVRLQTDVLGPWLDVASFTPSESDLRPDKLNIGRFDRATPVSYRVNAVLDDGRDVELWGYFQIREKPDVGPTPVAGASSSESKPVTESPAKKPIRPQDAIDLLALVDLEKDQVSGEWQKDGNQLISPKEYGARLELPYQPPEEYELTVIVEPLDEPHGLLLGQRSGGQRFATLIHYPANGKGPSQSALENIDDQNVGNASTVRREVLVKDRPSQIVCTVRKDSVSVTCDGHELLNWRGDAKRLSLSDYWKTPNETALFLGAYDCRYRFSRVTLTPLTGEGRKLR
jgi:hypothetical protein